MILVSLSVHLPECGCPNEVKGSDQVYPFQTLNEEEDPSLLPLCTWGGTGQGRGNEYMPEIS